MQGWNCVFCLRKEEIVCFAGWKKHPSVTYSGPKEGSNLLVGECKRKEIIGKMVLLCFV